MNIVLYKTAVEAKSTEGVSFKLFATLYDEGIPIGEFYTRQDALNVAVKFGIKITEEK